MYAYRKTKINRIQRKKLQRRKNNTKMCKNTHKYRKKRQYNENIHQVTQKEDKQKWRKNDK